MDGTTLHVKPAAGVVVRDPASRQKLPPEGAEVPDTTFWHRRLAEGDVTLVQTTTEAPARAVRTTPRSSS